MIIKLTNTKKKNFRVIIEVKQISVRRRLILRRIILELLLKLSKFLLEEY